MKRIHIALGVADIDASVADYSRRLDASPVLVIPGEYALWRTECLNLSIRKAADDGSPLRHLGIETPDAESFSADVDCNGITWERFSASQQADEIRETWPGFGYSPDS